MNNKFDVVIVGTGVAGLYSALQYPDDVSVLVISKKEMALSNSSLAQGGVAAVLNPEHDNFKLHIADTLIAGKYKNRLSAIEVLVTEGPKDVLKIKDMGVDFDVDQDGHLLMTLEAGHSRHRIVHHKDCTGKEISDTLIKAVKLRNNIEILENATVFAINSVENGFYLSTLCGEDIKTIGANHCVLATGGIGRVYEYTTNSAISTGDGITLAYELGATIKHLNRVQFHPTAFASATDRERFLISEAVRGEGAVLLNCNFERFADKYDDRGELAPRDVVSNAIIKESIATNSEQFYLDITHKPADFIKNRFPTIYSRCLEEGIDITKDKIPVYPCQHYLMGGIDVDLNAKTTIDGLYAIGESAHTGVHGANRLASNSLLEALVFSRRSALHILNNIKKNGRKELGTQKVTYKKDGESLPTGTRTEIRKIMQQTHFVVPRPDLVPESLARTEEILNLLKSNNYEITTDYVEAKSLATVASIILKEVSSKPIDNNEQ